MPFLHPRHQFLKRRANQAGLLSAGAAAPLAYQRTLMPRSAVDQALVSGLAFGSNHALTAAVQEAIQSAALLALGQGARAVPDDRAWSRASLAADAVALAAGLAIQKAFPARVREPLPRAAARTNGYWLARAAAAGLIIGGLQEALGRVGEGRARIAVPAIVPALAVMGGLGEWRRRRDELLDADLDPVERADRLKSTGLGLAVMAGTSGVGLVERRMAELVGDLCARFLPGNRELWRPVGHVAALAALGGATDFLVHQVFARIERTEESVEPALDIPPPTRELSGSLESAVPFRTLSRAGRRFVWTVSGTDRIESVMGEPAVGMPARLYVGLESADTEDERVALALDELDRVDAWTREWLMVVLPTGTGYVNYVAASVLEMLTRGDCASVAMQYAARPSPLSLDRVAEGRHQARLLLDAIGARMARLPADRRPKLLLFGESLGAWTSQDAFIGLGTRGLVDHGIDHAIWIGTPHFSKWKEQVLHDDGPDIDRSLIGVFNDIEEWRALPPEARDRIRYVMITHHDDGVAVFGPELAIQAPPWLDDPATRPSGVPKAMRWMPSVTFFQVLVDMKNAAQVVPGVLEAKGHDYRADLLPFFEATLGFTATQDQRVRITAFLMETELRRSRWLAAHKSNGTSLSAALAQRWMEQKIADGEDPGETLVSAFRTLLDETNAQAEAAEAAAATAPVTRGRSRRRRRSPRSGRGDATAGGEPRAGETGGVHGGVHDR